MLGTSIPGCPVPRRSLFRRATVGDRMDGPASPGNTERFCVRQQWARWIFRQHVVDEVGVPGRMRAILPVHLRAQDGL